MKNTKFKIITSFMSMFVIVFLLTFLVATLLLQSFNNGISLDVYAYGGTGKRIQAEACVYGYDEASSNILASSYESVICTINTNTINKWEVGDLVFAPDSTGNAVPIYFDIRLTNLTEEKIVVAFVGPESLDSNVSILYSVDDEEFAEDANEKVLMINETYKIIVKLGIKNPGIDVNKAKLDFKININDYWEAN